MIFRQLFDSVSGTYSYLLASRTGGEALILDPVLEKVDRYCQLLRELDLRLVKAVDTHLHAEEHTSELQSRRDLVCRLLLEKKKNNHSEVWAGPRPPVAQCLFASGITAR